MFDSQLLSSAPARAAEWRPGLPQATALHGEIFASSREAGGAGLALALALDRARSAGRDRLADAGAAPPWLWVQDEAALRLTGLPYYPGLPAALRHRLIHVSAQTPEEALFALEEGLRCRDVAFVVGEIAGNPKVLDFTASRRLSLAAERYGIALWLIRIDARRDLGSARMRWDVHSAPSPPPRWNPEAPGHPSWRAELFRSRNYPPGEWIVRDDADELVAAKIAQAAGSADHGDLAAQAGDRSLAAG